MLANHHNKLNVLSLLDDSTLEQSVRKTITSFDEMSYTQYSLPHDYQLLLKITHGDLGDILPHSDQYDVVLIPLSRESIELFQSDCNSDMDEPVDVSLWSRQTMPLVAVLTDDSIELAVHAANLDFDGILAEPLVDELLPMIFHQAIGRRNERNALAMRFNKVKHAYREVNKSRRHLRDKVDLLCKDLVQSNLSLTLTLQNMRQAYDFQNEIFGEFDLNYMLHKSLHLIKEHVPDSNAMIYLCDSDSVEAHLYGPWYDNEHDLDEVQNLLRGTIIKGVLKSRNSITIPDAGQWMKLTLKQRTILDGLTLMAVPVKLNGVFIGVVVLYRSCCESFTDQDLAQVKSYIYPLANAITGVRKLQHLIEG